MSSKLLRVPIQKVTSEVSREEDKDIQDFLEGFFHEVELRRRKLRPEIFQRASRPKEE